MDIIAGKENYFKKTLIISGPDNFSRNEIVKMFGEELKIKPRTTHVPVFVLKTMSVLIKPFHPGISRVMKLAAISDKLDESITEDYTIRQFGLTPTTMSDFIKSQIKV